MELNGSETFERKIIALAQARPKGISDKDLTTEIPELQPGQRANIINKLLSQGVFDLFKQGGSLSYRLKDPSKTKIVRGADNEEKIVYTIIEEAGNKGIWIRDIRLKSNLMSTQLSKVLKSLETKKFIKAVKSVAASKKKVYMLYNLEPDRSVTGGIWYQDQDFDAEFASIINQQCCRFLEQKKERTDNSNAGPLVARNLTFASSKEVWKYISDSGICTDKILMQDVETSLNTLVYDGKVERILAGDGSNLYRSVKPLVISHGVVIAPCNICPVRLNCFDTGDITPVKCEYIKDWL